MAVKAALEPGYNKARYIGLVNLFGRLNLARGWLKEHGRVEQEISSFHRPGEAEFILRAGYTNYKKVFNKIVAGIRPGQGPRLPVLTKKL
ncbi:MAG: hypothetical protein U5L76_05930 [Patescibacteria group bacterium]|nr:hypothetical protein [Patescibacteria group bacterium]